MLPEAVLEGCWARFVDIGKGVLGGEVLNEMYGFQSRWVGRKEEIEEHDLYGTVHWLGFKGWSIRTAEIHGLG